MENDKDKFNFTYNSVITDGKSDNQKMNRRAFIGISALAGTGLLFEGYKYFKSFGDKGDFDPKNVFDLRKEADAIVQRTTTLTKDQHQYYMNALELFRDPEDKGPKTFYKKLMELNNLPPEDRTPIVGRLLYHAAHEKLTGPKLMAAILVYCPTSKEIGFVPGAKSGDTKPVGIKELLIEGRDFGNPEININPWKNKKIEIVTKDADDIIKAINQHKLPKAPEAVRSR